MRFDDLRSFLDFLDDHGELQRITAPVDPILEIAEITDRVCKLHGPALLFSGVQGSSMPVVMNTFGSYRRTAWALGVDRWEDLGTQIEDLLALALAGPPQGFRGKLQALNKLRSVAAAGPRLVTAAPCQEVDRGEDFKLSELPILKCWPDDGGRYITLPLVFTHDPNTGKRNVGMYRLQVFDDKTLGMHWHLHKGGAEHYRHAEGEQQRLEVAVVLGAAPAAIYAATAPLPPGIDEMVFAGFLRGKPVDVVRCKTVDHSVPAHAEIVLEGYVDPAERRVEGPFGDHTGYYSLADEYPVLHVTRMTHRRDPIYPSIIVGGRPWKTII